MKLTSIASFLPGDAIPSEELDSRCGLQDNHIEKSTGVRFRHHAPAEMTLSAMAATAVTRALKSAKLGIGDIDLLLFTGGSFEQPIPHTSCLIKAELTDDRHSFPCLDIDATCLSFVKGLDIAHLYIQSGRYHRIVIVSAEMPSRAIRPSDPGIYGLFGDAAVAAIIEQGDQYEDLPGVFETYPSGARLAGVRYGGAIDRGAGKHPDDAGFYFQMEGRTMLQLTQKHLDNFMNRIHAISGVTPANFDCIIPHQPSKLGNTFFARQYSLHENQLINTLENYGNCISASIPLGLEKLVTRGIVGKMKVLLIGTAAGLSLGALALNFK